MHVELMSPSFTVRDCLLTDHRRLEDLFEDLLDAFEKGAREELSALWTRFESELDRHLDAEERFLIPAFARFNQEEANGLLDDHVAIRKGLAELGIGVDLHIVRLTAASIFIEHLRGHARREDLLLYRWGDEHLREHDRAALMKVMQPSHHRTTTDSGQ